MKFGKRVISIVICTAILTLSIFNVQVSASTTFNQNQVAVSNYLSQAIITNEYLSEFGLSLKDFDFINKRDSQYFNQFKEGLSNSLFKDGYNEYINLSNTNVVALSSNTDNGEAKQFSDRLVYASYIAYENKKIDRYATDIADETIYMYLSHYVDMDPGQVGDALDGNSYDGYLSAYITNIDRTAYKKYLSIGSAGRMANDLRSASTAIAGLLYTGNGIIEDLGAATYKLKSLGDFPKRINEGFGFYSAYDALQPAIKSINDNISKYDDPKELIKALENDLNYEDYNKEARMMAGGLLFGMIGAVCGGGIGGVFVVAGLSSINMIAMTYKDIYDRANWTALVYTLSSRVSERYMRYFEW